MKLGAGMSTPGEERELRRGKRPGLRQRGRLGGRGIAPTVAWLASSTEPAPLWPRLLQQPVKILVRVLRRTPMKPSTGSSFAAA